MKTFRSKLLACIVFCMCVPAVLGLFVYQDLQSRRTLEAGMNNLDIAQNAFQLANQNVHDFLSIAERDLWFFETGSSEALTQYHERMSETRDALLTFKQESAIDFDDAVDEFLTDIQSYEARVNDLTNLLSDRGLESYGRVGEMRTTIHALESRIDEPSILVDILMLRRHEKDYIIRNQLKYVEQLLSRSIVLQDKLRRSNLPPQERDELIELLARYTNQFRDVVETDQNIGMRGGTGLFQELVANEGELNSRLNHLRSTYTANMLVASEELTDRLFVSIAIVILIAIWLGLWLSRSLTRPLAVLSNKIQQFIAGDFAEAMRLTGISRSEDEIGQIARSFEVLQETMQRHLSRLQKQKNEMAEQRHRLETAQRLARIGYWRWDSKENRLDASSKVLNVASSSPQPDEDPIAFFGQLIADEDRQRFESDVSTCFETLEAIEGEYRVSSTGSTELWIRQHLSAEIGNNGHVNIIATVQDISEQRRAEQQIRRLAYFDNLTGVATRGYLNEKLQDMILSSKRRDEGFALFFIDLDGFKEVNDSLGHDAGDTLLVEVSNRLIDTARDSDFVARLGGDEFCMLIENVSLEVDIAAVAYRCLDNIMQPVTIQQREVIPAASIGVARYPEDGSDSQALMQAGDNAMYAAKRAGNHGFEFHNHQMSVEAASRLILGQEIRAAVREQQFVLFYQPQVSLASANVQSWEALIRWQHPEKGLLPPGAFIEEVERLNLINELGDWVVREACQQIRQWETEGLSDMRVSVNIAPSHLTEASLFDTVRLAIKESGIASEQLEIEVTETGIQSAPEARDMLNDLKTLGVRIAIDDFGTGYSSLGSLKHLPVDCLKIDRAFVKDVATNPEDAILLRTIMSLGHNFEFRIVAEGVEDLAQIRILQELECELLQGYFFSKPVPASEVPALAARSFREEIAPSPREQKLSA